MVQTHPPSNVLGLNGPPLADHINGRAYGTMLRPSSVCRL